jgi:signal transduction histidine kinase
MRWKLTVVMSLLVFAVSVLMASGAYNYMKSGYLSAVSSNRFLVVGNLATSAFEAMLREDMGSISFLGEQFGRQADVVSVLVLDQEDRVVYDSRHQLEGKVYKDVPDEPSSRPVVVDGKKALEMTVPFKIGEAKWATAAVTFSMASVNREISRIFRAVSLFCLLGILVGMLLSFFIARWITNPIEELTRGMNAIEGGDLDYRIRVESRDELERIGNEFNQMAERLKAVQSELVEKEKMGAIMELAGAAAHEINQPLTVVIGNIDFLLSQRDLNESEVRKALETMKRASMDISEIVKKMASIKRYETGSYVGKIRILDLDKSSKG